MLNRTSFLEATESSFLELCVISRPYSNQLYWSIFVILVYIDQESPTSRIWCLIIWGGTDRIIMEIKCTINVMCLNHLETTSCPQSMEEWSSVKSVPGAKTRLGTSDTDWCWIQTGPTYYIFSFFADIPRPTLIFSRHLLYQCIAKLIRKKRTFLTCTSVTHGRNSSCSKGSLGEENGEKAAGYP